MGMYDEQEVGVPQMVQGQSPNRDVLTAMAQEERVSNFFAQSSPSVTLFRIDKMLQGFIYDEQERKYIKISQAIPEKIRLDFLQMMVPHLTEDVRMGRLDERQLNGIMEFIIEWTVDYLDIVADDENLSEEQMTKISMVIWSAVFHSLGRSINGVERDKMYNAMRLGDDFSQYANLNKPKSLLDSIIPWR